MPETLVFDLRDLVCQVVNARAIGATIDDAEQDIAPRP